MKAEIHLVVEAEGKILTALYRSKNSEIDSLVFFESTTPNQSRAFHPLVQTSHIPHYIQES